MFTLPWSPALSAVFVVTGVVCVLHLAQSLRAVAGVHVHHDHDVPVGTAVHVDHLVMSLAMLLMIWRPVGTAGTWVQSVVFTAFAALMLVSVSRAHDAVQRVDLLGHVVLNAAMVWMLAAMPLLMGQPMSTPSDPHAAHHGGSMDTMAMQLTPTPAWAAVANGVVIAISVLVALWWLVRLARDRGHRLHAGCHLLMGAGMASMLALM